MDKLNYINTMIAVGLMILTSAAYGNAGHDWTIIPPFGIMFIGADLLYQISKVPGTLLYKFFNKKNNEQ